jgi:hypothetical protein
MGLGFCHFLLWFDYSKCCKFLLGAAGSARNRSTVEEVFGGEVQMQQVEQHNVGAEHMSRFVSLASDASDAIAQAEPKRGMILPFQPLAISFDNINYYVDMPVVCVCFFQY